VESRRFWITEAARERECPLTIGQRKNRLERAGRTGIIRYAVRLTLLRLRKKMILADTATGAAIKSRRAIQ